MALKLSGFCSFTVLVFGLAVTSYTNAKYVVRRSTSPNLDVLSGPSMTNSCQDVRKIPAELREGFKKKGRQLDQLYQKYTETYGIILVGSSKVSDEGLRRFCYTVRFLLAGHSLVRESVYSDYGHFILMAASEKLTDLPDYADLDDKLNNLGGYTLFAYLACTVTERNALCERGESYEHEDVVLHEAAHAVHFFGAKTAIPGWDDRLRKAYDNAMARNLWNNYYNSLNHNEYFAAGTQAFFDVGHYRPVARDQHGPITTRDRLRVYDPDLYELIWEVFPCDNPYLKRCEATRAEEDAQNLMMDCNLGGQKHSYCHNLRQFHTHCNDAPEFMEGLCPSVCAANEANNLQDDEDKCNLWSRQGECDKNSKYMNDRCKKSCFEFKNRETANQHSNCPLWAKQGYCKGDYADYMAANCQESCENVDLKDEDTNCARWASNGDCERNPSYMIPNCPVSCEKHRTSIFSNHHPVCPTWASEGYCVETPRYMKDNCEKSCYGRMMDSKLKDEDSDCRKYGKEDDQLKAECEKNPKFMSQKCQKSCLDVIYAYLSDRKSQCEKRAANGECDQVKMIDECPTFCFKLPPPSKADSEPGCDNLKQDGWCADTNNYMGVFCPKACGISK